MNEQDPDDEENSRDRPTSKEEVIKNQNPPGGVWYDEDGNVAGHVRFLEAPSEDIECDN